MQSMDEFDGRIAELDCGLFGLVETQSTAKDRRSWLAIQRAVRGEKGLVRLPGDRLLPRRQPAAVPARPEVPAHLLDRQPHEGRSTREQLSRSCSTTCGGSPRRTWTSSPASPPMRFAYLPADRRASGHLLHRWQAHGPSGTQRLRLLPPRLCARRRHRLPRRRGHPLGHHEMPATPQAVRPHLRRRKLPGDTFIVALWGSPVGRSRPANGGG